MKKFLCLLCLFAAAPVFAYYDNYTVIDSSGNTSGYIYKNNNNYSNSYTGTYNKPAQNMYSDITGTYQVQGNRIISTDGRSYIRQGNLIYEE